ncbi:hypothetical protein KCP71_03070 [Salmonella enterica subsp. enterica]|nr:hypothetical protein KCP71_03070 [Salmonella enterica subsp. enterica]
MAKGRRHMLDRFHRSRGAGCASPCLDAGRPKGRRAGMYWFAVKYGIKRRVLGAADGLRFLGYAWAMWPKCSFTHGGMEVTDGFLSLRPALSLMKRKTEYTIEAVMVATLCK